MRDPTRPRFHVPTHTRTLVLVEAATWISTDCIVRNVSHCRCSSPQTWLRAQFRGSGRAACAASHHACRWALPLPSPTHTNETKRARFRFTSPLPRTHFGGSVVDLPAGCRPRATHLRQCVFIGRRPSTSVVVCARTRAYCTTKAATLIDVNSQLSLLLTVLSRVAQDSATVGTRRLRMLCIVALPRMCENKENIAWTHFYKIAT